MLEGEAGEDIGRYLRAIPSASDSKQESDDVTLESINFTKPANAREISCLSFDAYLDEEISTVPTSRCRSCALLLGLSTVATLLVAFIATELGTGPAINISKHHTTVVTKTLPVSLPASYRFFLDTNEKELSGQDGLAVVWDIPGDGDVLQHILSRCMHLVAAGGAVGDKRQILAENEPLEIFEKRTGRYVNCFAGSQKGIDRIVRTGMVASGVADVIYAPLIYEVGRSFTEEHPAKMVAMFHDPIQRVASVFHIEQQLNPKFANRTLEEFLKTSTGANNNNWMTRELSNCEMSEVNEECLRAAIEVVEKKCFVGLTSDLDASLEKIYDHFGWKAKGHGFAQCSANLKEGKGLDRLYTDLVLPGSPEYDLIEQHNTYDIALYEAAKAIHSSY